MKSIRLALAYSAGAIHPIHRFVCESPFVERELLLEWTVSGDRRTLVGYVEGERDPYGAVLADRPDVEEYDLVDDDGDGFFFYARARHGETGRGLLDAFDRETVVVVPPVEFRPDRTMRTTLVGPPADLQAVVDGLPSGIDPRILSVGEYARGPGRALTDRQREAVAAAWAAGYYEVPRDGGIEAVADRLDCAISTASDLLRRAERRLVARGLDRPA